MEKGRNRRWEAIGRVKNERGEKEESLMEKKERKEEVKREGIIMEGVYKRW